MRRETEDLRNRFNEAEAIKPRIPVCIIDHQALALGFNEAEAIKPRIALPYVPESLQTAGFNEAEAIKPRIPYPTTSCFPKQYRRVFERWSVMLTKPRPRCIPMPSSREKALQFQYVKEIRAGAGSMASPARSKQSGEHSAR